MQDPTTSTGETPDRPEIRAAAQAGRHRELEQLVRQLDAVDPDRAAALLAELFGSAR